MCQKNSFVKYEYKEITASTDYVSLLIDCYENFGWVIDENNSYQNSYHYITIRMKRDRKIMNKMELIRLQRHFEACILELRSLETSKTKAASVWAMSVGIIGTAFMTGSVFAMIQTPPMIWSSVLLAILAFIGWILPYFLYQKIMRAQIKRVQPLIEDKYEEIYTICEKGRSLL